MYKDDWVRLSHMLDAGHEVLSFTKGRTRTDLDADRMLVLALIKDIEIIGEAANQINETTRDELRTIPWANIIGMRHRLVHAYFDINLDVLWQTLQDDIPSLITLIEPLLPPEPPQC
jgi:uncharacterized protein with HEPN domain